MPPPRTAPLVPSTVRSAPPRDVDYRLPELHAAGFRALLDIGEQSLGKEKLEQIMQGLSVTTQELRDPSAWFSLRLAEALIHELVVHTGNDGIAQRAAQMMLTPKYLGPLYPLYRAFGTPLSTYAQVVPIVRRTNKTGTWTIEHARRGDVHMTFHPVPEATQETTPYLCQFRLAQIESVPTLFGLPPAEVEHPRCIARGDGVCAYRARWQDPVRRLASKAAFALGPLLGLAVARACGFHSLPLVSLWATLTTAATWSLARVWEMRRELRDRIADIAEHRAALTRSEQAAEARYLELLEAKTEVDAKVETRTAELRETSHKLEDALVELHAVDRAKTAFFNNVSHELRTPLTLILAPIDALLAEREPPGGRRAALEAMQRNGKRLLRLINQLLDAAKIDAGKMQLRRQPLHLSEMAQSIAAAFEGPLRQRHISLQLELDPQLTVIALDPSWIESAVTNLVANAVRVVRDGGRIALRIRDEVSRVVLEVEDDGPGMNAADAARAFERFAQGADSREARGGTGLGLSIVREAIRMHGGDVVLETSPGRGAKFTLTLPRTSQPEVFEPTARDERERSATLESAVESLSPPPSTEPAPGPGADAPLALVVEDNVDLQRYMVDVLAARYRVCTANDGEAGLRIARERHPDVIVTDIAMPVMDGLALCRALRADDATRTAPCLLVTARSDLSTIVEGFDAGANDYLVKPFHATELLARVDVQVRLRKLLHQLARQERLAALGSIAAQVAHHVRNPLSALIAGLPAMRSRLGPLVDDKTAHMMDIMLECAERIERMTLDLLDLSRVDRESHGELQPGAGLAASARMLASRLPVEVTLETHVDERSVVVGRAGDLNHVFMNLMDNALRAVGSSGTIRVTGGVQGAEYVACVEDSGAGIDPAVIDRVFEAFWTTRGAGEGTGLGLAIAKAIVDEHSGRISVDASPLGGARFTVRLPLPAAVTEAVTAGSAT